MTPSARIAAAIELLEQVLAGSRPADAVANDFFRTRRFIGSSDRRVVSDRVWQVLRAFRRLSWRLEQAGGEPDARMLVAGLLAAEGASLEELREVFSGARFAPAQLSTQQGRVLARLQAQPQEDPAMPEPVRLEVPDWVLPRLRDRFGPALDAELPALNGAAPLDLRVNLLKGSRQQAQAALAAEGLQSEQTALSPWGLRLGSRRPVTTGASFQSGLVEIQDEGSQLIALLMDARPGMRVADWCAGAGGKTLALAMTMENRGQLMACDVSEPRLEGAVRRLRRAGVHNVERHLFTPGDKWAKRRAKSFDRVLVDAPCTGTGTWRRNPDARLRLTEADLLELLPKQAAILDAAQGVVRIGGRLVYATCSLLQQENEDQVTSFLTRHPGFRLVPLAQAWNLESAPPVEGVCLALSPSRHGTDGFFAAVLERVS